MTIRRTTALAAALMAALAASARADEAKRLGSFGSWEEIGRAHV